MRSGTLGAMMFLLVLSSCTAHANSDADEIERLLGNASSVKFYLIGRTGDYDYSAAQLMEHSTIEMRRSCGANCHRFMAPVIALLRASKPMDCLPGQQDVLIVFDSHQIMYSYNGRQARYKNRCYFNERSVRGVIERDRFLFN